MRKNKQSIQKKARKTQKRLDRKQKGGYWKSILFCQKYKNVNLLRSPLKKKDCQNRKVKTAINNTQDESKTGQKNLTI